ncbi:MAG TPA: helix-turn-helix transcriptional regulator [Thermoanaerobaculia bacterium]|nr:helix-turn-helix transcriptional regulator [Thermoanaerobaculia bacterium]
MSEAAGSLLREWRQRRRLSQLDLASDAEISTRHLSFVETGRANPSREMVLRLAERLDVPLRERNAMLVAAGFAPVFQERSLTDPALGSVQEAIAIVLEGHEPYPALAIDRHWTLIAANRTTMQLLGDGVDAALMQPPVNVLRVSLHPGGIASRIVNLATWRAHLLERLRRQIDVSADPVLVELLRELREYPAGDDSPAVRDYGGVIVPLELRTGDGVLSFFSTTTVFGTPVEITVSELAIESFFPANPETAAALRQRA